MFALEIDFHDGISPPETILVRRSNAIVGSSERAHVVIEGAASSLCELRLVRGLGREFSCHPVRRPGQNGSPPFLEGVYAGEVELRLGELTVHVSALDIDLALIPDEFPDRAAIRVLRTALTTPSPIFPAVAVMGAKPIFISFPGSTPLLIGRSRNCGLRLDASDVSSEHARVGMHGDRCWVEDLGSTNGTFVGEERVSGRRYLDRGESIRVGSEFMLAPVLSADDVAGLNSKSVEFPDSPAAVSYPCLIATSEQVRPARFALKAGAKITIGRDPANDIWISAPHISRSHLEVSWDGGEAVEVIDYSSNGTFIEEERLERAQPVLLPLNQLSVLDFCSGVLLGICHSAEDERRLQHAASGEAHPEADLRSMRKTPIDTLATTGGYPEVTGPDDHLETTRAGSPEQLEVRRFLERAAPSFLPRTDSGDEAEDGFSGGGVFQRLARRHANKAQEAAEVASDNRPAPVESSFDSLGFNAGAGELDTGADFGVAGFGVGAAGSGDFGAPGAGAANAAGSGVVSSFDRSDADEAVTDDPRLDSAEFGGRDFGAPFGADTSFGADTKGGFGAGGFGGARSAFDGLEPEAGSAGSAEELSEFEQYQRSQRSGGAGIFEVDPQYNLLEEEFDEDILESSQYDGYGRAFLVIFVVGLVIIILLLCMLIIGNDVLLS